MVAWFVVCLKTCKLARDVSQKAFKKKAQVHLAIQMYSRVKFKGVLCSSGNTALLARSTQPNQWEAVAGLSSLFGNVKKKRKSRRACGGRQTSCSHGSTRWPAGATGLVGVVQQCASMCFGGVALGAVLEGGGGSFLFFLVGYFQNLVCSCWFLQRYQLPALTLMGPRLL